MEVAIHKARSFAAVSRSRIRSPTRLYASGAAPSQKIPFTYLDLRGAGLSILERLVLEECLLRHDPMERNWLLVGCHDAQTHRLLQLPRRWDSDNPATAIVLGIGGKPRELLDVELVKAEGCVTIKRFSGGGTVVLDPDSIWTTVIGRNKHLPHVEAYPRPIMEWTATDVFGPTFSKLQAKQSTNFHQRSVSLRKPTMIMDTKSCGVENTGRVLTIPDKVCSIPANHDTSSPHSPSPIFALRENDYVLGERKMGGNAQAIVKGGWLHHTSFLWDYQPENMAYLTLPNKRPDYRGDRPHHDFLVKLHESYPHVQKIDFFRALSETCQDTFDIHNATLQEALTVADAQGGLQKWFEKKSRTRILQDL